MLCSLLIFLLIWHIIISVIVIIIIVSEPYSAAVIADDSIARYAGLYIPQLQIASRPQKLPSFRTLHSDTRFRYWRHGCKTYSTHKFSVRVCETAAEEAEDRC
jgi:hypothetical protein